MIPVHGARGTVVNCDSADCYVGGIGVAPFVRRGRNAFMRHLIHHSTRTLAALAIVAFPNVAIGQTPTGGAAAQPNPAAEHLSAARRSLNKVLNAPAPSGDAFKKLTDIKTHYIALEKAASTASPEWNTHYQEIDR